MKYLIILAFSSSFAYADMPAHIQVQGKCDTKVSPDRGTIVFTAENQFKDQKAAVTKTTAQINSLKEKITALKLKDMELKNTSYTVMPVQDYERDKVVHKGFRASLSLEVTTSEIARLGETMTEASQVGITNAGSMNTFLSLAKSQAEYLKCLDVAADDAREKGRRLAKKLNFELGDVVTIIEAPAEIALPPPYPMDAVMRAEPMRAKLESTQVEAGTVNFQTSIQVSFKIK